MIEDLKTIPHIVVFIHEKYGVYINHIRNFVWKNSKQTTFQQKQNKTKIQTTYIFLYFIIVLFQ